MKFGIKKFDFFFDRDKVIRAISSYERRVLTRTGAFGRKVIRNDIRNKAKSDKTLRRRAAKRQLTSHTGRLKKILFAYEPRRASVIIGPFLFAKVPTSTFRTKNGTQYTYRPMGKTVPQLLNEGGSSRLQVTYRSGNYKRLTINYKAFHFVDKHRDTVAREMRKIAAQERLK